ncbi:MAG: HAD family hydrolase [Candidatus Latescibacteria bacterium]|nr:HAD family hydrolase [Candidatus Latescibacterota bacterium]
MTAPYAFLFDMDGTLLDSRRAVVGAVAAALGRTYAHCGLPPAAPDLGLIEDCMGLPGREYFARAYPQDSVPGPRRDEFAAAFARFTSQEEIAAIRAGGTALYDGVETALAGLKERGHELLLFSNADAPYFRGIFAAHGLDRFFARSLCIGEAEAGGLASDKTGMVRVLAADPSRTVVVGDRASDLEAGRAAGARTVGCLYGFGTPHELRAADWTVDGPLDWLSLPLDGRDGSL